MREILFRVWHRKEKKMYFRGYQKLTHVLLCGNDFGKNGGKGIPEKEADYGDCEFMENTSLQDRRGEEIFEGDIVKIASRGKIFEGEVGDVPDMFRSRNIHPLQTLFEHFGIQESDVQEMEIIGNRYEGKTNGTAQ